MEILKKTFIFTISAFLFLSCGKDGGDLSIGILDVKPEEVKNTVLIYAVNNSSLSYYFNEDASEMLKAASKVDLTKNRILLYKTIADNKCGLYTVDAKTDGSDPFFTLVKQYDRDVTSTHPDRIKEVIDHSLSLYPNSSYDLVFWGHGMSWRPYFTDHKIDVPMDYAYGGEYTGGKNPNGTLKTDWTEINDLAAAVPDHKFETVWFDCCYMSGIEVMYEFKDKCNTFVAYPSEVWDRGLPYDLVLPYLLDSDHDLVAAADSFYQYYAKSYEPVTVAVMDMSKMEKVADKTKDLIGSLQIMPNLNSIFNYSYGRPTYSPFYDLNDLMKNISQDNNQEDRYKAFKMALDEFILYHAESDYDFSLRKWDSSKINGINSYLYLGNGSKDEAFYKTLAWYKRVYP